MSRRLMCLALVVCAAATTVHAQVIDRILAVVDKSIITQSDVIAAMRLGLVPAESNATLEQTLERLIERRLTLNEVERYAPPAPATTEVERRIAEIRRRFTPAEFDSVLAEGGVSLDDLQRQVRDDLRIDAYLLQRFGAAFQPPSEEDILEYYRSHPADFSQGGRLRPFGDVHDQARAALVARRRATQIQDWVNGLRRRADVHIMLNTTGKLPIL